MQNCETLKFQLDLTRRKLDNTSLFIHSTLRDMITRHMNANDERTIRNAARMLHDKTSRETNTKRERITTKIHEKYPFMESWCSHACTLSKRLMTIANYNSEEITPIEDFFDKLLDALLRLVYIHPKFFLSYELRESLTIINKHWDNFIAEQTTFEYEVPSLLTTENKKDFAEEKSEAGGSLHIKLP